MTNLTEQARQVFKGLTGKELKSALRRVVSDLWPDIPPWSTLTGPVIEETQKSSNGCGVVLTYEEQGERYVILGQAGAHYKSHGSDSAPAFTIPGGFINLSRTPGSLLVAASNSPESPRVAAARETEEEFKKAEGTPLFSIDPDRLKPMDTAMVGANVMIGMMLELSADQVRIAKDHVRRLEQDDAYKAAVAAQTCNEESNLPEIEDVKIFKLSDVAAGKINLLHKDQQSLFLRVQEHFTPRPRTGPTLSYQQKIASVDELQARVAQWRASGNNEIGVTSGVFDLVHPGHISFCEDARQLCDRLIVIIASDRTVREQKGAEKPYINEYKRAQTMAALEMVDAVVISDEKFHETILTALRPDILFKGDDYAGMQIMGAELVGRVALIPCAEKIFYSSSAFARKIKEGTADNQPGWVPA